MQEKPAIIDGVREGEVLAGKYRIERILGAGGMGIVVAAHHLHLDERVAIKLMLPEVVASQEALARFAREARAAVKIKSEHVARVSDVGSLPSGAPYMVMEYLEGIDLGDWLEQRGRLPIDQAAEFVLQACEAIAEAHALGIVHRDLKPRNLFVVRRADGLLSVKVLDFGISKVVNPSGSGPDLGMTGTTAVMGSPLYMSPEQMLASRDADARSDIWSLGVILYELLTAALPFRADTMPELVAQILGSPPLVLRTHRSDAPPALEAVIARCLDKDRGKRYQTVGDFAVALLEFAPKRAKASVERIAGVMSAAGLAGTAFVVPSSDAPPSPPRPGAGTAAAWGTTAAKSRSSGKVAGIAVLGLFVTAGIAIGVVRRQGATEEALEPATSAASSTRNVTPTPVTTPEAAEASARAPAPNPVVLPASASAAVPAVEASPSTAAPAPEPSGNSASAAARKHPSGTARPTGHRPPPGAVAAQAPAASPSPAAPPTAPAVVPAAQPKPATTGWGGRL
jgi:hypothetical protein